MNVETIVFIVILGTILLGNIVCLVAALIRGDMKKNIQTWMIEAEQSGKTGTEKLAYVIEEFKKKYKIAQFILNAKKFIENGNKVRITMRFRGREMNYTKQGEENLLKFEHELKDIATAENKPVLMGRNMFLTLIPKNESKK